MIALHHVIPAVAASGRSVMCAVNVLRCRKYGICDTGVVNIRRITHDTGLIVLLVHQDAAYVVCTYPFRVHNMIASIRALHHAKPAVT